MNEQTTSNPLEPTAQRSRFFSVLSRELKGCVQSITANDCAIATKKNGVIMLSKEIHALLTKAKVGDLLTLTLLLETSPERKQAVPAIKVAVDERED